MVQILGRDYAWMTGCVGVVVAICVVMPQMVGGIPWIVRIAMLIYAWLAILALTGATLHAKREVLERETRFVFPRESAQSPAEVEALRRRWLDSIYAACRAKAYEDAWRSVMSRVERHAEPLPELRWLYTQIVRWEPPQFINRIAREMLHRLLAAHRDGEALQLVQERLAVDVRFRPNTDDDRRRLAQLADRWGDRLTAQLLRGDSLE
jgi:hypothetical protein